MENLIKDLTDDVLHQVLARLPVKSLLRFRLVCKSWNALISTNSHFIKSQHQRQLQSNVQHLLHHQELDHLFTLDDQENITFSCDWWLSFDTPYPLRNLYGSLPPQITLVTSCYGLMLFNVVPFDGFDVTYRDTPVDHYLTLWNPSLRKYRLLSYRYNTRAHASYGISYDPLLDSYKVVVLLTEEFAHIMVYDVTTDTWSASNEPNYDWHLGPMVSVNGLLHCVCGRSSDDSPTMVVVYFEMLEARLKEVPQPDYGNDGHGQFDRIGLAALKDELCLYSFPESKQELKIWIRKAGESWNSFAVIPYNLPELLPKMWNCKVLSLTEEGQVVVDLDGSELFVYSRSENRSKTISTSLASWSLITHVDSLVLINVLQ